MGNKLLVVLLVLLYGCSDLDEMFLVQQDFACKDKGGVWVNYMGFRTTSIGKVKCNNGTWQQYSNVELPEDLWLNKAN